MSTRFHIVAPVKWGGQVHKPGAPDIEAEPGAVAELVANGSLAPVAKPKAKDEPKAKSKDKPKRKAKAKTDGQEGGA